MYKHPCVQPNGCMYKHPCVQPNESDNLFLILLTEKLSKEKVKEIKLLGDFNIDLTKTNSNNAASGFFYIIYSKYL